MSNYLEQYSKKQIQENLETVFALEYLGVHIEETKNLKNNLGLECIVAYYFAVPEFSTIEVDDSKLNEKIKTADGLITVAKEEMTEMFENSLKDIFKDDDYLEVMLEDFKANPSENIKFYAKVRKGETWTKEMGLKVIEKINNDIQRATGYKEV